MFEIVGVGGLALSIGAYVPQVVHLGREHCSAGVSPRAWAMWVVGGLLIGAMAVAHRDAVFIAVQATSVTSSAVILGLAHRYRGMRCASHVRTPTFLDHPAQMPDRAPLRRESRGNKLREAA